MLAIRAQGALDKSADCAGHKSARCAGRKSANCAANGSARGADNKRADCAGHKSAGALTIRAQIALAIRARGRCVDMSAWALDRSAWALRGYERVGAG